MDFMCDPLSEPDEAFAARRATTQGRRFDKIRTQLSAEFD
jgi:hypothetical protein